LSKLKNNNNNKNKNTQVIMGNYQSKGLAAIMAKSLNK